MMKIMILTSVIGGIPGYVFKYNRGGFFGALRGIGFGFFLGMIISFVLYVMEVMEKSYF